MRREKRTTRGLCHYKIFALGTLNMKGHEKKNVKKDKLTPLWTSLISLKRHTPSHNTLLYIIKMFSVTQTVTQSVRLNATVSKRDVTRRYEEVLLLKVFSVRVGSIIHFVLF